MEFEYTKAETKKRSRSMFFACNKLFIYAGIASMILTVFFILVGIFDDREALSYGYSCLAFASINAVLCIASYFALRMSVANDFKAAHSDIIHYTFELSEDGFTLTKTEMKKTVIVKQKDINRVSFDKSYILIHLKGCLLDLPRTKEIEEVFVDYKKK